MRIVVLTKPVPDPAAGAERLGPDCRARPAASPASSTATTSTRSRPRSSSSEAHGGEVTILVDGAGQRHAT